MEIKRLDENGKVRQEFYEYALKCCDEGIEIWVDVVGYEGYYQVSNFGRIKALSRIVGASNNKTKIIKEKYLATPIFSNGYYIVSLYKNRECEKYLIHRLISIYFIPNPENKPEVNHKDGIKTNIRLDNFEWATHLENMRHAWDTRLCTGHLADKIGEYSLRGKPVLQFDKLGILINRFWTVREAARSINISTSAIERCARGRGKTAGGYKWKYECDYNILK